MMNSGMRVKARSPSLFHLINFISFAIAVLLFPFILSKIGLSIQNLLLQYTITIIAVYVAARYVFPAILFFIAQSGRRNDGGL